MKTKLLRKLRKKSKRVIVLAQTDNYMYEIRMLYFGTFDVLSHIGGAFDIHYFKKIIDEYRRKYILEEIKHMRKSIYPKTINI